MQSTKNLTVSEAQHKMERYCAYQERCHKEVVEKLKGMRMIPDAIDHIIGHLIKENYLSEERFARSFARGKFNIKKWGRNRIINELKQRQISKYNIINALKEIDEEEYHITLDGLAKKRWEQVREGNIQRKKRKTADYLLYRGWESDLVYQKLKELQSQ